MQRDGMLDNEAWGKPRDRLSFPEPHGNGLWTQAIYYKLLDCGLRIPPSAGSASGVLPNPVGYNRVYVYCGKDLTYDAWWENLKAGQVVVTNGPLIRDPRLNGKLPGHVFQADAGQSVHLEATLNLSVRDKVDYLEIVKDGVVVHQVRLQDWAKSGGQLPPVEFDQQRLDLDPRGDRQSEDLPLRIDGPLVRRGRRPAADQPQGRSVFLRLGLRTGPPHRTSRR